MSKALTLGTRVILANKYVRPEVKHLRRRGTVIGYSGIENQLVFLIRLDKGFYSPERDMFITAIVCDESAVEAIPSRTP